MDFLGGLLVRSPFNGVLLVVRAKLLRAVSGRGLLRARRVLPDPGDLRAGNLRPGRGARSCRLPARQYLATATAGLLSITLP